jgi:hypothetical protein
VAVGDSAVVVDAQDLVFRIDCFGGVDSVLLDPGDCITDQ